MYRIKEARFLAPDIKLFKIEAAQIARKRKAGQFVIVRVHEHGERIPLTIADSDSESGTITIIVQLMSSGLSAMRRTFASLAPSS
jgi:ferredoxin--NADP+ reductase